MLLRSIGSHYLKIYGRRLGAHPCSCAKKHHHPVIFHWQFPLRMANLLFKHSWVFLKRSHVDQLHTKDKIIRPKDLAKRSRSDRVHCARLQVNEDCTGNILVTCVEKTKYPVLLIQPIKRKKKHKAVSMLLATHCYLVKKHTATIQIEGEVYI